MPFDVVLAIILLPGLALLLAPTLRLGRLTAAAVAAGAVLALWALGPLVGYPLISFILNLLALVLAGGWVGLVLLASGRLRALGRRHAAARAALIAGLALAACLPVALLRVEAGLAATMHQFGSGINRPAGGQALDELVGPRWRDAVQAELRWRSLLPLHPPCVTGAAVVCARLDEQGYAPEGWREGLGPAIIAATLAWALTLPPVADRRRGVLGALHSAYGGVSAGLLLIAGSGFLSIRPLAWLFLLPWTEPWPAALPVQGALAATMILAGLGIRRGRSWGPVLALCYALATAALAVALAAASRNPGLLSAFTLTPWYGDLAATGARLAVSAAIIVVNLQEVVRRRSEGA